MASNPYVNRVDLADGTVLVNLTQDTVTAGSMVSGRTAHDATGARITGTLFSVGSTFSTDRNIHPASYLGFGTWKKIRESEFTWNEAGKHTWNELKQDTWNWKMFKKKVYVWVRIA